MGHQIPVALIALFAPLSSMSSFRQSLSPGRFGIASSLLAAISILIGPSVAAAQQQPTPPEYYTLDARGVDLVSGGFNYSATDLVIGDPNQGGIVHGRIWTNGGWRDLLAGTVAVSGSTYTVSIGPSSEVFTLSGSVFTPTSNNGSTLTESGSDLIFTTSTGAVATYTVATAGDETGYDANGATIASYRSPTGELMTYNWNSATYCRVFRNGVCLAYVTAVRLESVTTNRGYQVNFTYATNTPPTTQAQATGSWLRRTSATGVNLAVDYCPPSSSPCTGLTRTWPSVTYYSTSPYGGLPLTVTDQSGRITTYTYTSDLLTGIRLPGSSADDVSVTYSAGKVSGVTDASGVWTYGYSTSGSTRTTISSGSLSQQTTVTADLTVGRATSVTQVTSITPAASRTTSYQYDGQRRLTRITEPEGNRTDYTYDVRGNATQTVLTNKSGTSTITTSAAYPASCANPVICNKPTTTTDAGAAVTNYAWNATHGGLESATAPLPTSAATVRPETRISYAAQTAYYKNSSGVIVAAPTAIILPVSTSACASNVAPACVGTADETKSTVAYGSSGVANNLLPTSMTSGDGTGALAVTTAMTYDPNGDMLTVDGPLTGAADTVAYVYNVARQSIGVIGPDPDGGGALLNRAQRMTYDGSTGLATKVEVGTTNGYNLATFTRLQQAETVYDVWRRPVVRKSQDAAGATLRLQQIGYDAGGRPDCAATRMNPAVFSSFPATGACTQGALGGFGPDRIVQTIYDAASRPIQSISGVGTASTVTESVSYTSNGLPAQLVDGRGNQSAMFYDGFDRLQYLHYPNPTTGLWSLTDYELYAYDSSSNVTIHRDRSNVVTSFSYDALNRLGYISATSTTPEEGFYYDNLNRPLWAHTPSGTSWAIYWGWDALSRNIFEQVAATSAGVTTTLWYGYDAASRRTSITWPDGVYANYSYNTNGELSDISLNGSSVLWGQTYDNLGRPVGTTRGNGVTSSYGYDGLSRLTALTQDVAGTAQDVTFAYGYDPAGQITTRTVSNSAYVFARANASTGYVNDGLNRVTTLTGAGAASIAYDPNQNITTGLGATYGYNSLNQLTTAGVYGLTYDPIGRLYTTSTGAAQTKFLYSGQQVIGEYDQTGAMTARYVPGLGLDNVVTIYAGSGTTSPNWPLADERQSVIAQTNGSGVAGTVNTYDDYGVPGSGNGGRFQYTGQVWLTGTGIYHYRARAYSPQIGRFLQTDPSGYSGGMNLYVYVGNDPVNFSDPMGLDRILIRVCGSSSSRSGGGLDIAVTAPRCYDQWVDFGGRPDFSDHVLNGGGSQPIAEPDGVSTQELICQARNLPRNHPNSGIPNGDDPSNFAGYAAGGASWFNLVKPRGAWDFKTRSPVYEGYGNFAYGATGYALGLPESVLLRGAGWAQERYNSPGRGYDPAWGNFRGRPPYGDDPRDQESIRRGIQYAKDHPCPN